MMNNRFFPLTYYRLRFHLRVLTPLKLGGVRAGSNLRGALMQVMLRATCPYSMLPNGVKLLPDPNHIKSCPVCWLVAAKEKPGVERRGYVLTPPINPPSIFNAGDTFTFQLTLLGSAQRFLPYFVLAVPEAGEIGIGAGRGRYSLTAIFAEHPLKNDWQVFQENENILRPPSFPVGHENILQRAEMLSRKWGNSITTLEIDFLTPMRLIWNEHLVKIPDFSVLFSRLLERLDELSMQFAQSQPRPPEERKRLYTLAQRVRLLETCTRWQEVPSGSSRTGAKTWISGIVGSANYGASADVWRELLPWLLWGEIVQVGKDTVKGNGVFRIRFPESF